jgi:hypothetical protein
MVFSFFLLSYAYAITIIRGNTDPPCESQAGKAGPTVPGNAKAIVENVEQEWATVIECVGRREAALREQMERERSRTEAAEARVEELERVLEEVNRGEFPVPAPGSPVPSTPARGSTDILTRGMMDLSPTVVMASRAQRSGKPSPRCMRTTSVCTTSTRRRTPSMIAWLGRLRKY